MFQGFEIPGLGSRGPPDWMVDLATVRVVSWNIHRCFGTDRLYRPERILRALSAFNADLILLQELDSSLRSEDGSDQLRYFARGLNMDAVMGPTLTRDYGAYGNVILSRMEIVSCEEYDLSFRRFEPRGALAVRVRAPTGEIRVINTHLGLKYWERAFQIDRLLAGMIWREEERVLLAGDFNEWFPFTGNHLRLKRAFTHRSPRTPTFPATWPRFALDRIFLSGPVQVFRVDVPREPVLRVASDHLPLVAEVEFIPGSAVSVKS